MSKHPEGHGFAEAPLEGGRFELLVVSLDGPDGQHTSGLPRTSIEWFKDEAVAKGRFESLRMRAANETVSLELTDHELPLSNSLYWKNPARFTDHYEFCPACGVSLQGAPIPEKDQKDFGATHYGRKVHLYDRSRDCTTAYCCPDCDATWMRDPAEVDRIAVPQPLDGPGL